MHLLFVVVVVVLLLLFRDVSDSESSDSENIYQVPGTDPIYDIPSGRPVLFQHQTETETETEIEPESNKVVRSCYNYLEKYV